MRQFFDESDGLDLINRDVVMICIWTSGCETLSLSGGSMTHPTTTDLRASGIRPKRKSLSSGSKSITHVTPRPLLEPIREVKRESLHIKRKIFHVIGVSCAGLTYALTNVNPIEGALVLLFFASIFVTADVLRFYIPALNKKVKKDLGMLMRDYELDGISGASWFLLSGIMTILLFPKIAAALGMMYLAVGDPVASYVGVTRGRIKIPGNKSLEGSLALFGVCAVLGTGMLVGLTQLSFGMAVLVGSVSALAAAFAEWLPIKKLDDNFLMPPVTAAAVAGMMLLVV